MKFSSASCATSRPSRVAVLHVHRRLCKRVLTQTRTYRIVMLLQMRVCRVSQRLTDVAPVSSGTIEERRTFRSSLLREAAQ